MFRLGHYYLKDILLFTEKLMLPYTSVILYGLEINISDIGCVLTNYF